VKIKRETWSTEIAEWKGGGGKSADGLKFKYQVMFLYIAHISQPGDAKPLRARLSVVSLRNSLMYLCTKLMEQSLLEKLTVAQTIQEISSLLWNQKVHYHVQKRPPPVSILRQINPIQTRQPCFIKIQFDINLFKPKFV
jgi:hypothetical protein